MRIILRISLVEYLRSHVVLSILKGHPTLRCHQRSKEAAEDISGSRDPAVYCSDLSGPYLLTTPYGPRSDFCIPYALFYSPLMEVLSDSGFFSGSFHRAHTHTKHNARIHIQHVEII